MIQLEMKSAQLGSIEQMTARHGASDCFPAFLCKGGDHNTLEQICLLEKEYLVKGVKKGRIDCHDQLGEFQLGRELQGHTRSLWYP